MVCSPCKSDLHEVGRHPLLQSQRHRVGAVLGQDTPDIMSAPIVIARLPDRIGQEEAQWPY